MMEENQLYIPEGWEAKELGTLYLEKRKSKFKVSDATNYGGIPFYTSGDAILVHNETQTDGENIFLATGGIANVKFYNGKVAYSTDTYVIVGKENIDTQFLYFKILDQLYYINTNYFQGSGLKHLQKKDFRKHLFVIPKTKGEQQSIANILSKCDKAIAQTEALIAKYTQIKTGLMQDLLTKGIDENGNIRSEETHEFKDSPLGRIPKEWECEPIGDCCYVTKLAGYEFTLHMKYREDGEIIALRALNIKNEDLVLDDIQRISQSVSDFLIRSKLFTGDILITYIGAYIGDVVQIKENDKYHLAPNIAKIVVGKKLTPDFLEMILRTQKVQNQFKSLTTTTANPSLTMGQIRKSYILFPQDKEEQIRIAIKLQSLRKHFLNLKSELSKLQSLKTGLMQDLLSGKVRVNNLMKEKQN